MVRKSVLVPEEFYHLFMEIMGNESDLLPLAETKMSMDKLMRSNKIDSTAKKELYNQYLQSYLKHKKAVEEKPVRVELVDDFHFAPSGIYPATHGSLPQRTPTPPPPLRRRRPKAPKRHRSPSTVSLHSWSFGAPGGPPVLGGVTPPVLSEEERPGPSVERPIETPKKFMSPQQLEKLRDRAKKDKIKNKEKAARDIYRQLMNKPAYYGVSKKGEIMNPTTKIPMAFSNAHDAEIVIKKMLGIFDPRPVPGHNNLEKILKRDPHMSQLIKDAKEMTGGGKRRKRKANKSKKSIKLESKPKKKTQRGKGQKPKTPRKMVQSRKFKPQKWRVVK